VLSKDNRRSSAKEKVLGPGRLPAEASCTPSMRIHHMVCCAVQLLQVISPLNRGATASPSDREEVSAQLMQQQPCGVCMHNSKSAGKG
jgi:hypothetical protein